MFGERLERYGEQHSFRTPNSVANTARLNIPVILAVRRISSSLLRGLIRGPSTQTVGIPLNSSFENIHWYG